MIRPDKIFEAVKYLINQDLHIKHNVNISNEWLDDHSNDIECLEFESDNVKETNDCQKEAFDSSDEEDETQMGIQDTLLEENESDETIIKGIQFAPGEKNIPISYLVDEDAEELTFPKIYAGQIRNTNNQTYKNRIKS